MVLVDEPAGSRLCCFALAFVRHAKSFASNFKAYSLNWTSEVSCSLLFKFVTKLLEPWEILTQEWVLSLFKDQILISTPYLSCKQQVATSNTGPILVFPRRRITPRSPTSLSPHQQEVRLRVATKEYGKTRRVDQQKPKIQTKMTTKEYRETRCVICQNGLMSSRRILWKTVFWNTETYPRVPLVFKLTSRRAEIATSAWKPKLQGILAENALVQSCQERKKTWQLSGYNFSSVKNFSGKGKEHA